MMKKMKAAIPKKRILTYLLVLGFLPILLAFSHLINQKKKLDQLSHQIENIYELSITKEKKEASNNAIRSYYKKADHFFIDKYLENIPLLTKEIEALQKITQSESYTGNDSIEKRLTFLIKENRLIFSEGSRQKGEKMEEVMEILAHPVELDTDDLLEILSRIEGKTIGNHRSFSNVPQMIITDFSLTKKKFSDSNEALILNMKLLKREYL